MTRRLRSTDNLLVLVSLLVGSLLAWNVSFASGQEALSERLARRLAQQQDQGYLSSYAFSPDGSTLATGSSRAIRLFDVKTNKQLKSFPAREPSTLLFTPDGKTLIATMSLQGIVAYDLASGKTLHSFLGFSAETRRRSGPESILSLDGNLLMSTKNGDLRFWNTKTGEEDQRRRTLPPENRHFSCIRMSEDGEFILIGTDVAPPFERSGKTASVHLFDVRTGRLVQAFPDDACSYVTSCSMTPDNRLISATFQHRKDVPRRPGVLPRSPDDYRTEYSQHLRVLERYSGKTILRHNYGRAGGEWSEHAPTGRILLAPGQGSTLDVWNIAEGKVIQRLNGLNANGPHARFLPDGKSVVTSYHNEKHEKGLLVWDIRTIRDAIPAGVELSPAALERLWKELAEEDAFQARQALWRLVGGADAAVPFLQRQLQPVSRRDDIAIQKLIAQLDSNNFASRQKARQELALLSRSALPALTQAIARPASLTQRKEAEEIVRSMNPPYTSPERLRRLRAIEALERIGTPQARKLLAELTRGASGAPETEDAVASLRRLEQQDRRKP